MKNFKVLAAAMFVGSMFASQANATLVGYELNGDVITDTNRQLEWLQWDATRGMQYGEAVNAFSAKGWKVASRHQMANLLDDAFGIDKKTRGHFNNYTFTENGEGNEFSHDAYTEAYAFSEMFAPKADVWVSCDEPDSCKFTSQLEVDYGKYAQVWTSWLSDSADSLIGRARNPVGTAGVHFDRDESREYEAYPEWSSVALVRNSVTPVPVPNSLLLFGSVLVGFGWLRRRKSR